MSQVPSGSQEVGAIHVALRVDESAYNDSISRLRSRLAKNEGIGRLGVGPSPGFAPTSQQAFSAQWGMDRPQWAGGGNGGGGAGTPNARRVASNAAGLNLTPEQRAVLTAAIKNNPALAGNFAQQLGVTPAQLAAAMGAGGGGGGGGPAIAAGAAGGGRRGVRGAAWTGAMSAGQTWQANSNAFAAGAGGGGGGGGGGSALTAQNIARAIGLPVTTAALGYLLSRTVLNAVAQAGPAIQNAVTSGQSTAAFARGDVVMGAQYRAMAQRQIIDMTRSIPIIGGSEAALMENSATMMRWINGQSPGGRAARNFIAVATGTNPAAVSSLAKRMGLDLETDFDQEAQAQVQLRASQRKVIGGFRGGGYYGSTRQLEIDRRLFESDATDMKARGVDPRTIANLRQTKEFEFSQQKIELDFSRQMDIRGLQMQSTAQMMSNFGMKTQAQILSTQQQFMEPIAEARMQGDAPRARALEGLQSAQIMGAMMGGRSIARQINPFDEGLGRDSVRTEGSLTGQDPTVVTALMQIANNTASAGPPVVGRN